MEMKYYKKLPHKVIISGGQKGRTKLLRKAFGATSTDQPAEGTSFPAACPLPTKLRRAPSRQGAAHCCIPLPGGRLAASPWRWGYQPVLSSQTKCGEEWCSHCSASKSRPTATPWTAARQASLSFTVSQSLFKLMSTESVMPSNHLILCHPLLLLPSNLSQHQGLFQ